ncbi:MAG: hypothetical protein QOG64_2873, partial [Acidimicrobiaceae bacterium]|nr:hypothetical protein [Acidimicrobiaceae bacterium]
GDRVYGTVREGASRRFRATTVLDHWSTIKRAYRITLEDGTELIASRDHRFLSDRGWKYVIGAEHGAARRPHLTRNNTLIGTGRFPEPPKDDAEYRRGYLCGLIRGCRVETNDGEAVRRAYRYLTDAGISPTAIPCTPADATASGVGAIGQLIAWPEDASASWSKGFLAGIFDAAGNHSRGLLRICHTDPEILGWTQRLLQDLGFDVAVALPAAPMGLTVLRIRGGVKERLRFLLLVDPAIRRKRTIDGVALKGDAALGVSSIEALGIEIPMFDITTGTGDFIANGVVSHNCFARPTHDYLGLNIGEDFERRIVVKVNAVERTRAELAARRWAGHHIAMGTNTDPYQRAEGKYHLTQGIIRVLGEAANPFSILTKSTLILRDLDLLRAAAERTEVHTSFSIGTLDEEVWKLTEPGTPHPRRRVEAVRKLNDAGIPCGVLIAPVIPGLSDRDDQLREVVEAVAGAGAVSISAINLHLRAGVREHFLGWLGKARPDLLDEYQRRYRRAYLPAAEQKALTERVRRMLPRRARPTQRSLYAKRPLAPSGVQRTAVVSPAEQLPLL